MSAVFSGYSIASNISCYELINSYKGSTDFINNTNQFSEQFNKILDTAATFD